MATGGRLRFGRGGVPALLQGLRIGDQIARALGQHLQTDFQDAAGQDGDPVEEAAVKSVVPHVAAHERADVRFGLPVGRIRAAVLRPAPGKRFLFRRQPGRFGVAPRGHTLEFGLGNVLV